MTALFTPVDYARWPRRPWFEHYMHTSRCNYSLTWELDVTALVPRLKQRGQRFYPAMLYMLATVVNRHAEFRTALGPDGLPGVFSHMEVSYTLFRPESETFTVLWTAYNPDFAAFAEKFRRDAARWGGENAVLAKPEMPQNVFDVSSIPWITFTGFNLNLFSKGEHLLPIFTFGRYREQGEKILLPVSMQLHHAVCDAYHAARFAGEVQALAARPDWLDGAKDAEKAEKSEGEI